MRGIPKKGRFRRPAESWARVGCRTCLPVVVVIQPPELWSLACDIHAERLLAKAGGSKGKGRGIAHPEGTAERRSAQAKRGRLGTLLARARGGAPLSRS